MLNLHVWALVILLSGAANGGQAVNTSLRFTSAEACQTAADRVNAVRNDWSNRYQAAVCVELR